MQGTPIPIVVIFLHFVTCASLVSFFGMLTAEKTSPGTIDMRVLFIPLYVLFGFFILAPFIATWVQRRSATLTAPSGYSISDNVYRTLIASEES
jgi:hypothetical protein